MEERTENKMIHPKRAALIAMSNQAAELRETMIEGATNEQEALFWSGHTINQMLLDHMYDTKGASEFNTFKQWKEKGATIKKGETAFIIWGQPLNYQRAKEAIEKGQKPDEEDDYKYFPLCFLFSNLQVITAEEREAETQQRKERKEKKEQIKNAVKSFETVDLDSVM